MKCALSFGAGCLALSAGLVASSSFAQVSPEQTLPGVSETLVAPQPREIQPFILPDATEIRRAPLVGVGSDAVFVLNDIQVSVPETSVAKPLLSDTQIAGIITPYRGRRVTLGEVAILRDQLTRAIIAAGYITSGAEIESLDSSSGVLKLRLVRGRLEDVVASGYGYLSPAYLRARFRARPDRALSASELQADYQLLLEDRNVAGVNAVLRPGARPGEAVLVIEDLVLRPRREVSVFSVSDRSPAVGATRTGLRARTASVLVTGDELSAEVGRTEGLYEGRINYGAPLNASNWNLNLFVQASKADIIDEPLNALDATSANVYYGAGLSIPLRRRPGESLTLSSSVDRLRVETELLGMPFSFSPGAVDGRTEYSALRNHLVYAAYGRRRSFVLGAGVAYGLSAQAGTRDVDIHFTKYSGSFEFINVITVTDQRLVMRAQAQYTDNRLFASEMLSIGGMDSVRGFRQNSLIGAKGYVLSVEYQTPVSDLLPGMGAHGGLFSPQRARLGVFFDTGWADSPAGPVTATIDDLSSVGLRLTWTPTEHLSVETSAARRLNRPITKGSYQDDGLGFKISYRF